MADISPQEAKEHPEAKRPGRRLSKFTASGGRAKLEPRIAQAPSADLSLPPLFPTGAIGNTTAAFAAAALVAAGQVSARGRGSVQAPGVTKAAAAALAAAGGNRRGARGGVMAEQELLLQEEKPVILHELFRKIEVVPSLYWLPLSEEEVGERKKKMKEDGVGSRNIPMPADYAAGMDAGGHRNGGSDWGGGGSGGARGWIGEGGSGGRRGYGGGSGGGGGVYGNRFGDMGRFNRGGRRR